RHRRFGPSLNTHDGLSKIATLNGAKPDLSRPVPASGIGTITVPALVPADSPAWSADVQPDLRGTVRPEPAHDLQQFPLGQRDAARRGRARADVQEDGTPAAWDPAGVVGDHGRVVVRGHLVH